MRVKLTKVSELGDALHPNNIETGFEKIVDVDERYFDEPEIGQRFNLGFFSTSGVQEIIDDHTFKTYNSIYHWEVLPNNE